MIHSHCVPLLMQCDYCGHNYMLRLCSKLIVKTYKIVPLIVVLCGCTKCSWRSSLLAVERVWYLLSLLFGYLTSCLFQIYPYECGAGYCLQSTVQSRFQVGI